LEEIVADPIEKKELSEEEIIGEQLSKEYIEKVPLKQSAEVRMFIYVVCAAAAMVVLALILSRFAAK
jgi:hypothetical protein